MTPRTWLAFLLVFLLLAGANMLGSGLVVLWDLPTLLLVCGVLAGGILQSHSMGEIGLLLGAWYTPGTMDSVQATRAAELFGRLSSLSLASGMVGLLIGLVQIFANLEDPREIGPAMGVCLLSMFYAVILSELVFGPLAADCLGRVNPSRENPGPAGARDPVRS